MTTDKIILVLIFTCAAGVIFCLVMALVYPNIGYKTYVSRTIGTFGEFYVNAKVYYNGRLIFTASMNCGDYQTQDEQIERYKTTCKIKIVEHKEYMKSKKKK